MNNLPWKDIIDLVRFLAYILLIKWGMEFFKFLIKEVFGRYCKHCDKKI